MNQAQASPLFPFAMAGTPGGEAALLLWRSTEVGQQLQQQWAQRMRMRSQEMLTHTQAPTNFADWWDLPLAGMRWGLQEWDQVMQALLGPALTLRGAWLWDHGRARWQAWMLPEASVASYLDFCQQQVERQSQAWSDLLTVAGHQRHR